MSGEQFPSMEEMLGDLSRVEGMAGFFSMLALAMQTLPGLLTDGECAVVESTQPIPYELTDAGRALLDGK